MFKKITAIATLIIAVVVVVMGISLMNTDSNFSVKKTSYSYDASYYDAEYAAFGADFYTYMYEATDIIVSELNDISYAISTLVEAQNSLNSAIAKSVEATNSIISNLCKAGGMIVIAIGLVLFVVGLNSLASAFEKMPATPVNYAPYSSAQYNAPVHQAQPVYTAAREN